MKLPFSRTVASSIFGKRDVLFPAFRVESVVLDAFTKKAAEAGKPTTEYLRDLMAVAGLGREHVVRLHRQNIDRVANLLDED